MRVISASLEVSDKQPAFFITLALPQNTGLDAGHSAAGEVTRESGHNSCCGPVVCHYCANVCVPNRDQVPAKYCANLMQTLTNTPRLQALYGT